MRQQAAGLLMGLALAVDLSVAMNATANEGDATFKVEDGYLSLNVWVLARSHGWSLEWLSEEDRVIAHAFHITNPSLEAALSEIFAPHKGAFSTILDWDRKVVRVVDVVRESSAEGALDAEGDESLRGSAELDFEPGLESTAPPESPPSEDEKETVRMLEIPQPRERGEAGSAAPGTASGSAPAGPVLQILSARNKGKVEQELSRLRGHGHDVFLEEFHHHGTLWYRLKMRVAPGQSVGDAKAELKGLGHDAVWVVPRSTVEESSPTGE